MGIKELGSKTEDKIDCTVEEQGRVIGRAGRKSAHDEDISRGLGEGQRGGPKSGIGRTEKYVK